jgi:hypothetical protein
MKGRARARIVASATALLFVALAVGNGCGRRVDDAASGADPTPVLPGVASAVGTPDTEPTTTVEPATTETEPPSTTAAPTTAALVPVTARPTLPPTTARPAPAPSPAPAAPLAPGPNSVFVEGDSVLLGTATTMPAALAGWAVTMDTVGSRRLTQAIPVLQARRGEIGRVVVIQMGNNYIPGESGSFASQIDRAMTILGGVERVVWLTVAQTNDSRAAINDDIRSAAERWPTIVVVDWASIIAANPGYASSDSLHLTGTGRTAMAQSVATAVGPAP